MLEILNKLLDIILVIAKWISILVISSMTIFLFLAVLSRYLFSYSFYWIDAYSRYSLIFISFLGAPMVLRMRKHVSVDVVIDLLPKFIRKWVIKIDVFLIFVFSFIMFIQGIKLYKLTEGQIIPDLYSIKMSNITIIIPISAVLIMLIAFEMIFSPDLSSLSSFEEYDKNG